MSIRYFEIRSPRADFTGVVGAVAFADGRARVSFDDERDGAGGRCLADEPSVQVGRSAVLFAQRRPGYVVIETDVAGQPLDTSEPDKPTRTGATPKGAGK
ncbi:hypothetical protein GCM10017673_14840 [Streptosporangium violaceochromogenes]|nr:hypothetical protein GCM10017673_14840 [Streptosporangium violaceochromogenes]